MASSDEAVNALFDQTGVVRVDNVRQLFAVGRTLACQPLPAGRNVAIVGNSGGPGILAADACAGAGLEVPQLSGPTIKRLATLLPPHGVAANPCDLLASAGPEIYRAAVKAVLDDERVDAVVVIFTPTLVTTSESVAEAIGQVADGAAKPVLAVFIASPDGVIYDSSRRVVLPRFESAEDAVTALARIEGYAAWLAAPSGTYTEPPVDAVPRGVRLVQQVLATAPEGRWLNDAEAAQLLTAYELPLLQTIEVTSADMAADAAAALGFPVALKVSSAQFTHKSDVGGVALDLADEDALRAAWTEMDRRVGGLERAVLQPMAEPGVEVILGAMQDPDFGPLVMFGAGGSAAELLDDKTLRLTPLSDLDASEMVRSLRTSPLLFGYRGALPVDTGSLERALCELAMVIEHHPEVAEVDLNPVVASPSGVVAVDVKVRITPRPAPLPTARRLDRSRRRTDDGRDLGPSQSR